MLSASFMRSRLQSRVASAVMSPSLVVPTLPRLAAAMRTTSSSSSSSLYSYSGINIPWELPPNVVEAFSGFGTPQATSSGGSKDPVDAWAALGRHIVQVAQGCDAGPAAFEEVLLAREQLETMVDGAGYGTQLSIALFGSVVVNSLVELGGDVDFVAVADREPDQADAAKTVVNIAKELRRLGLRSTAIPRARVPIVRTDRVSRALPGTPVHQLAHSAVFRYQRPSTALEQSQLETTLREQFCATRLEWNGSSTLVAEFPHTSEAVRAIAFTSKCGQLDIPLRLPADPKQGPELYRYSFDLCLHSSGLQNSWLFRNYLEQARIPSPSSPSSFSSSPSSSSPSSSSDGSNAASPFPYARHLLLFVKRWASACGIVNTHDGMLSSYAVSVMLIHFLVRVGVVPPLQLADARDPTQLPKFPEYRPLDGVGNGEEGDVAALGFLAAHYLAYYAHAFKYDSQVVCTTTKKELHKSVLRWGLPGAAGVNGSSSSSSGAAVAAGGAKRGGVEPTSEEAQRFVNPTKPPYFSFCIKDPYNAENIARNLAPAACGKVQKLHDFALQMIARDGARDAKFVVSSLVDANGPAIAGLKRRAAAAPGSAAGKGASSQTDGGESASTSGSATEGDDLLLSPEEAARRELSKMAFASRKESLSRVGVATAKSHEQTRAAQDLTRSIVDWIRAAEKSP